MFITAINKLFYKHGKITFGILTIVIIIPFVLYFSADPSDFFSMFSFGTAKSNVSMYGERVPQKKLDQGVKSIKIIFALRMLPVNFNSTQNDKQYLSMAIKQLMLIKQAERLDLMPTDVQIAEFLRQIPLFQVKGKFNMDKYRMILDELKRYRISEMDIEGAAKESILIDLLKNQITSTVVISENGAKQFYNRENEKYAVKIAYFDSKDYLSRVKINNKELGEYFQVNRSKYIVPKKSKASIVRFNFINYKKESEKEITDQVINANYQQNKLKYKMDSEVVAKSRIKDLLIRQKEQMFAKRDAQNFAVKAFKNIEELQAKGKNAQIFSQFSKKLKYNVHSINNWITVNTKLIPKIGKESTLAKEISNLFIDQPISNAVEGKKAYFVACLTDRENARLAKLSEVRDRVISAYKNEQAVKMAQNAANKLSADIIKDKKSVKNLLKTSNFSKIFEFTAKDSSSLIKESYGKTVLKLAIKSKNGGVSSVVDISNGAIIVYVDSITPPSEKDFSKNRILAMMKYKQYVQQISWLNYNQMIEKKAKIMIYATSQKGAVNQ